jgi:hypothetical protein
MARAYGSSRLRDALRRDVFAAGCFAGCRDEVEPSLDPCRERRVGLVAFRVDQHEAVGRRPANSIGRTCGPASICWYASRPTRTMRAKPVTSQHMQPLTMKQIPPIIFFFGEVASPGEDPPHAFGRLVGVSHHQDPACPWSPGSPPDARSAFHTRCRYWCTSCAQRSGR